MTDFVSPVGAAKLESLGPPPKAEPNPLPKADPPKVPNPEDAGEAKDNFPVNAEPLDTEPPNPEELLFSIVAVVPKPVVEFSFIAVGCAELFVDVAVVEAPNAENGDAEDFASAAKPEEAKAEDGV